MRHACQCASVIWIALFFRFFFSFLPCFTISQKAFSFCDLFPLKSHPGIITERESAHWIVVVSVYNIVFPFLSIGVICKSVFLLWVPKPLLLRTFVAVCKHQQWVREFRIHEKKLRFQFQRFKRFSNCFTFATFPVLTFAMLQHFWLYSFLNITCKTFWRLILGKWAQLLLRFRSDLCGFKTLNKKDNKYMKWMDGGQMDDNNNNILVWNQLSLTKKCICLHFATIMPKINYVYNIRMCGGKVPALIPCVTVRRMMRVERMRVWGQGLR